MPSRSAQDEYANKVLKNCKVVGGFQQASVTNAVDGAIDPASGVARLTKGSAGAYTLRAPVKAENGLRLSIVSTTAFAHVVTATNLLSDGVTGGPKDTATFAAFAGAAIDLMADDGLWIVLGKNAVTVAGS